MPPPATKASQPRQQQPQQRQQQPQQRQQLPPGNDDLMPSAPPAFPQPVSSLPRDTSQYYPAAFPPPPPPSAAAAFPTVGAGLPVSSNAQSFTAQHQQQPQPAWPPGLSASGFGSLPAANGAAGLPFGQQGFPGLPAGAAAATATAPFGYGVDGLPLSYDVAMAPYATVYSTNFGSSAYGGDAGLPLLTDANGFAGDMVFANRQMRHAFVRKVLGLVTLQLLLTAAVASPIVSHKPVRHFLHANPWVFVIALIVTSTLLLVMACSEAARRRHPTNLLLLAVFTIAEGCLVGTASATYATNALIVALFLTAAVCLALIAYASQTSVDFSASGGMLYSAVVVLLLVTAADGFLGFKTLHLLIGGCGALLFCAYLVYDVQLLASGESSYAVSADEYVFGAINVYTDVITLFLHILQVMGQLQGDHEEYH